VVDGAARRRPGPNTNGRKENVGKLTTFLAVTCFVAAAVVAGVFWLLALPYRLWRPVFERAYDWCADVVL